MCVYLLPCLLSGFAPDNHAFITLDFSPLFTCICIWHSSFWMRSHLITGTARDHCEFLHHFRKQIGDYVRTSDRWETKSWKSISEIHSKFKFYLRSRCIDDVVCLHLLCIFDANCRYTSVEFYSIYRSWKICLEVYLHTPEWVALQLLNLLYFFCVSDSAFVNYETLWSENWAFSILSNWLLSILGHW